MKKSLLTIAVTSTLMHAAMAQSSVTVYGRVDANVEWVDKLPVAGGGSGSRIALNSGGISGSRFGLMATEDLGGNLKASFKLENGFSVDTGAMGQGGRLFGRQAWLGLQSDAGSVKLGRQYTTMFDLLEDFSISAYPTQYEPVVQQLGVFAREDNVLKLESKLGPMDLEAHYAFGEQAGATSGSAAYGAGLGYTSETLGLALAYDNVNSARSATGVITRSRKFGAGARYIAGQVKIFGGYRWASNDIASPGLPLRDDYYWIGANYQATPLIRLSAAYYFDKVKSVAAPVNSLTQSTPQTILFTANYGLSKRTDLYVTAAYAKNSALNLDTLDGGATGYALAPGAASQTGVAIGVRHKF